MRESRSEVWHVAQRRLVALLELRRLWTTGNSPLATLARVGGWRSHMTDARTIIIEALGPEVPASWRKQVADRMFTALRSAGFEVCAVAAPTITPQPGIDAYVERVVALAESDDSLMCGDGVGGSITPQPTRETFEACVQALLAGSELGFSVSTEAYIASIDEAVKAGDAPQHLADGLRRGMAFHAVQTVLAVLDGVSGSITPADLDSDQRCGHNPLGHLGRRSSTVCELPVGHEGSHRNVYGYWRNDGSPADQEDIDD